MESLYEEWPTLLLVLFVTVVSYAISIWLDHESLSHQIAEHLAIALVVALVLMVTVEIKAKQRTTRLTQDFAERTSKEIKEYRDSVASEVWKATCERAVPKEIVKLLDGILKYDIVKEDCQYVFTFLSYPRKAEVSAVSLLSGEASSGQEEVLVLRRELTYHVRNLTDREVDYSASSTILSEFPDIEALDDGAAVVIPRHLAMKIDEKPIDLDSAEHPLLSEYGGYPHRKLAKPIRIAPEGRASVYICSEEEIRHRGKSSYIQINPMINVTIMIKNHLNDRIKILPASLNHPNWKDFLEGATGVFTYRGGMLPGQGIRLSWIPLEQEKGRLL
ncbi:MAG: hypothetical protein K8J08_16410 [Thermoanaerobaculia bacterium]|nr:hypothetical protein [Thermoanaerobaculia bacterium]